MITFQKPKFKLGVAPTRRDMWFNQHTTDNKNAIMNLMNKFSEKYDFELVTIEGLEFEDKTFTFGSRTIHVDADDFMTDYADAKLIATYFKEQEINALFVPFCNFGQEDAVARLAYELKLPTLLWGARDVAPEGLGMRPTDTQCGMFACSKVLLRYGVKFTYIENCHISDDVFEKDFEKFLSVARVVNSFNNLRIGQISVRPQQFLSVMVNEAELLEKFGIELVTISGTELVNVINGIIENEQDQIDELVADIEKTLDLSQLKDKKKTVAAIELGFMKIAKKYGCNALASDCWHVIRNAFGVAPCFIFGDLHDRGLPTACELDIHAAIVSVMATAATAYKEPAFVADLTLRHPQKDNVELLWHCGPFAKALKKEGVNGYVVEGGQGFYPLKHGDLTVLRFDGLNGDYSCFVGVGKSIEGPETNGNYVWLEVDDWVKWEKKFIYGPYIHHVVGLFGDYSEVFKEACRYIGINYDTPELPLF
ncbi:MAG: sugar isomerase [Clostridiales bacterium]|nr:sugar isomerase [Clostridiales bacterium]